MYLYDIIDPYFGVSAAQFVKTLNSISAPQIDLHINSPGGDVFDGRAMATAIAQHPSHITAYVDGLAASAASTVAIAAKDVVMAPGSFMMIHNAWAFTYGNASELRSLADILEKIDQSLIDDYARASGASVDQVKSWMDAETWFSAQETIDAGLADRMAESAQEEGASNAWDLSVYQRAPKGAIADIKIDVAAILDTAAAGAAAAADPDDTACAYDARIERLRQSTYA